MDPVAGAVGWGIVETYVGATYVANGKRAKEFRVQFLAKARKGAMARGIDLLTKCESCVCDLTVVGLLLALLCS